MNLWIHKCAAVLAVAGALSFVLDAAAEEKKVQKITFIEDDAQKNMASKIYTLKYSKAADIAPFIRSAAVRYCRESHVSTLVDSERKREMLIVSTGIKNIKYIDAIVEALDRNAKFDKYSNITGNGIAFGFYQPTFRAADSMFAAIVEAVASGPEDAAVRFDAQRNMYYFKDTPATVADIKDKLAWLDKPVPQSRIVLTVYEVRDSDLKDIGIDYLAWKNGPGMNLLNVGYNALSVHTAERIIDTLSNSATDLLGTASWGFGGFYSAPSFDMSFIRLLQQNGKATVSSSADVVISNVPGKTFAVNFAPEYQNIAKDARHAVSVAVGGDAALRASIRNAVITSGKNGKINFDYEIVNSNVVERNNLGAELTEEESVTASTSLDYQREKIIATWNRTSEVEQTIGVPVLCELPVLKYIFGTTTKNTEVTRCIVTAKAIPVVYNENMAPGVIADFDEICKK